MKQKDSNLMMPGFFGVTLLRLTLKLELPVNVTLVGASTLRVGADVTLEHVLGASKRSLELGT